MTVSITQKYSRTEHRDDDHVVVPCTSLRDGVVTFFISVRTSL